MFANTNYPGNKFPHKRYGDSGLIAFRLLNISVSDIELLWKSSVVALSIMRMGVELISDFARKDCSASIADDGRCRLCLRGLSKPVTTSIFSECVQRDPWIHNLHIYPWFQ
jgi:hypothetical protein